MAGCNWFVERRVGKTGTEMVGIAADIEADCTGFVDIEVAGIELEPAVQVVRNGIGSWLKGGGHGLCCCILGLHRC